LGFVLVLQVVHGIDDVALGVWQRGSRLEVAVAVAQIQVVV